MLDASRLGLYRERIFLTTEPDFSDAEQVKGLFEQLLAMPIDSKESLRHFLACKAELYSAMGQYGAVLHINLTCHTENEEIAEQYRHFTSKIQPISMEYGNKVDEKFLAAEEKYPLDAETAGVLLKGCRKDIEIFRDENIPLMTENSLLIQKYEKLAGAQMVVFDGKEQTFQQMAKYNQSTDRDLRERAWLAVAEKRFADKDAFDELYSDMVLLRGKIARNAGFPNYVEYCFASKHRFDYTSQDCKMFHNAVEKLVVPVLGKMYQERKEQLGVDILRPWDLEVDPLGREPLKPFETIDELLEKMHKAFVDLSPMLADLFQMMRDKNLFDLDSRKGKAPGGYQCTLSDAGLPFIFANFVGVNRDLKTLFHEGGHAFHAIASRDQEMIEYRHAPMEFCEVASMAMELLTLPQADIVYSNKEDADRSRRIELENAMLILSSVAMIDAFQHAVYENEIVDAAERAQLWLDLGKRFMPDVLDATGFEELVSWQWQRILHFFKVPMYYIEYGIAELGALGVWRNSLNDKDKALADYWRALSAGGSKTLTELFELAGVKFGMDEQTIAPLIETASEQLAKL